MLESCTSWFYHLSHLLQKLLELYPNCQRIQLLVRREADINPNISLKLLQSGQYKNKLHFFHSTVAWRRFPGQIGNRSLCQWEYSGNYFYMLRLNGVMGLTLCSFDITKVSWKCRDEKELHKASRKRLGTNKHQHGNTKMLCPTTWPFSCLPGRAPNLHPSPSSPDSRSRFDSCDGLGTTGFSGCPHLSWWWAAQGYLVGTDCLWLLSPSSSSTFLPPSYLPSSIPFFSQMTSLPSISFPCWFQSC